MEAKKKIRIGSRESRLAVIQAEMVIEALKREDPGLEIELVTMKTTGDIILDKTLDKIGGKGLFVKELDKALLEGEVDLTVHSLKDMPMEVSDELPLLAFSKREDPRDVLVLPAGVSELDLSKPIGCSSMRRIRQLKQIFPNAEFEPIRGNVQTRLAKVDSGEYSATVLAYAGLKRLGLEDRVSRIFETWEIIPAAGQGIIVVQGRRGTEIAALESFNDDSSKHLALAERAFVRKLDGGCSSPIAAYAEFVGEKISLRGFYVDESGTQFSKAQLGEKADAEKIGEELAAYLTDKRNYEFG